MDTRRQLIQSLLTMLLSAFAAVSSAQEKAPGAPTVSGAPRAPAAAAQRSWAATALPRVDAGAAAALTRRLTASPGVTDAIAATREALALGGVSTWDGQRFLVEASAPAAAGYAIPEETVALAMEARQRPAAGRLTLAQLGMMLKDLGWPFPEGRIPGEELRDIFKGWVMDGLAQPADRFSFAPLFLREMALTQQPAIDLAKGDYDPQQLHVTLLELDLLAAHFDRLSGLAPHAQASLNRAPSSDVAMPATQPSMPCPELKNWLDSAFGGLGDPGRAADAAARIIVSDSVKLGLKEALRAAGFTEVAADRFGKALSALSIASRLWKLVALYTQAQVAVTVNENPIHAPSSTEGEKTDVFRALAGVSDQDWQEYQKAMTSSDVVRGLRDCFRVHGLPVIPDLGDMGKEAKDWHVEWRLQGAPDRVRINEADNAFVHPGFLRVNLTPEGDHAAAALLRVEILPERGAHTGPQRQATAVASAALHTAKPPSIATWVNAVKGGLGNILALSNALVELCAGWVAEMLPPKAYASLTATYHESAGVSWSGRIDYRKLKMEDKIKSGRNAGDYAFMLYNVDYWCATSAVDVSNGKLRSKTQLEEVWELGGSATAIFTEENLTDNWRDARGCKGNEVATEHERAYSLLNAGGTGSVTGTLMISNNGSYELNFGSLPEAKGELETQHDSWWENKPCVDDKHHDQDSVPRSAHVPGISVSGKLDPKKPGVLSGHRDVTDRSGYRVTVTWNLRQKY